MKWLVEIEYGDEVLSLSAESKGIASDFVNTIMKMTVEEKSYEFFLTVYEENARGGWDQRQQKRIWKGGWTDV